MQLKSGCKLDLISVGREGGTKPAHLRRLYFRRSMKLLIFFIGILNVTQTFVTSQYFLSQERRYNGGETATIVLAVKQRGEELNPAQAISMLDMDEPARPHVQAKKEANKGG